MRNWCLRTLFVTILLTLCCRTAVVSTSAYSRVDKYVNNSQSSVTDLYDTPNGTVIGQYYNGVIVNVYDDTDGWSAVTIGSDSVMIRGHIQSAFLCMGSDIDVDCAAYTGVVHSYNGSSIELKNAPSETAQTLGEYIEGVKVVVIGCFPEWYHIVLGTTTGFLRTVQLEKSEILQYGINVGIKEIGFAITELKTNQSWNEFGPVREYAFPSFDAEIIMDYAGADGDEYELIADLGDWLQVRWSRREQGFMRSDMFKVINTDKWLLKNSAQVYTSGIYEIGDDIPSGLYTFTLADNKIDKIEITGSNTTYNRIYTPNSDTYYTLYLPDGSVVNAVCQGFSAAKDEVVFNESNDAIFADNGLYWLRNQFSDAAGGKWYYSATLKPGTTTGKITLYNVLGEVFKEINLDINGITSIETVPIFNSRFLEMYNCTIEVKEVHDKWY
ncbi:hypothetical protein FACS1894184_17840 [Clostridia bacterium]|nr:hypothetical protein FACS1894184_17840 [Clostridia bacterium]